MSITFRYVVAGLLGLAIACFRPPDDDVLFSCDPIEDDRCPAGYTCELDGCCHKDGTDVEASFGACEYGGMSSETASDSGSETGTESETATDTETATDSETTDTGDTESTDGSDSDTTSG